MAAHTFRTYLEHSEFAGDSARLGLGFAELVRGNLDAADEAVEPITKESMLVDRDTIRFWINLRRADGTARERLDPYTALGLCANRFYRGGSEVLYIVPGSLLDGTRPVLRPDDRIWSVGDWRLDDGDAVTAMREADVPEGVVPVRVFRDSHEFEVEIDYGAVHAALGGTPTAEGAGQ